MDKGIINLSNNTLQYSWFDMEALTQAPTAIKNNVPFSYPKEQYASGIFYIQNRRYLGNKYKLTEFISDIIDERCDTCASFFDIFAGTGVVGSHFNERNIKVISNDILYSNFVVLKSFLGITEINLKRLKDDINLLNELEAKRDNYFSNNFGNTYFTLQNARKIGAIREKIDEIANTDDEKYILLTALIYATDKVANTVGHYDAYRKNLDTVQPLKLLFPHIQFKNNLNNEIYCEDANNLIKRISCDVLYIDPPYNSRQYCDAYHLLENLATWNKPSVFGKAKKMDRMHLKSAYCLKAATRFFADLIRYADCKHILVSYNNTGESKDNRSNARIKDNEIVKILKTRGRVEIFERDYKAFTTGKSCIDSNTERVFYCNIQNKTIL